MLYAYLSGRHPRLPKEELKALIEAGGSTYRALLRLDQLAVFDSDVDKAVAAIHRAAFVKEVGTVLAFGSSDELPELVTKALELRGYRTYRLELTAIKVPPCCDLKGLIAKVPRSVASPSLSSANVVRAFVSEGAAIVGEPLAYSDMGDVKTRSPPVKPFWRSGELDVRLSRAMVNLSRPLEGGTFLDPFCGTGTLAVEAWLAWGGKVICMDLDKAMVHGSALNVRHVGAEALINRSNAAFMPLRDESVDSIATDPPYGRSTKLAGDSYSSLIELFLKESKRVLRSGGYAVYAGPTELRPYKYAVEQEFRVVSVLDQFVHSGLVRQIVVAKKPQ
ncbi:MAG: RsmD family RNA methyltransferase [Acidilobus sp.]